MLKYWWVNHRQTARQEVAGQYLWSPKREAGGSRSQFYDNMRRAAPGDLVLSYANQEISNIGRVAEFAFTSPKPQEFGQTGAYWNDEGWLLPVRWTEVSPKVRPKLRIDQIAALLPSKYSPLNAETGGGNQKAYLAEVSEELFWTALGGASYDANKLMGVPELLNYCVVTEALDTALERTVSADLTLSDTMRECVLQARRGQGLFRRNVEAVEGACRITGITNPAFLRASHIKPWRDCESAQERLDGSNGLLLSPNADALFDRGYVTFDDDGHAMLSPSLDPSILAPLGVEQIASSTWRTAFFSHAQQGYLDYHRHEIFLA